MPDNLKKLRIFVASPSDVANERTKLEAVVNSLKPTAEHFGFLLEILTWRNVIPGAGRPQQTIFDQLKPTQWDIFIGILWHRFGTPSNAVNFQTGKPFASGTEEEFITSYDLWKEHGKPRIMIYRCTRSLPYDVDPDQLKQVNNFFNLIQDPKSDYRLLSQNFDTVESFEDLLRDNLQKMLIEYSNQTNVDENKKSNFTDDVVRPQNITTSEKSRNPITTQNPSLIGHPTKEWITTNKITLSNGMEFMRIPAGKFLMGSKSDESEKPQHTIDISYDYWMARFPVTKEQYNDYIQAKGIDLQRDWEKRADHPAIVTYWDTAIKYCQWINTLCKSELPSDLILRLPTEAEWEKAARGTDGRDYPWGNQFDGSKCNAPVNVVLSIYNNITLATTPVRKYSPLGDSPFGCADMVGNLREWTHSEYRPYPYSMSDGREDEQKDVYRVLRGGFYGVDSKWYVRCSVRIGIRHGAPYFRSGLRIALAPAISEE